MGLAVSMTEIATKQVMAFKGSTAEMGRQLPVKPPQSGRAHAAIPINSQRPEPLTS